jgi:RNA polymerase-binding transcription factor DksA
VAQLAELAATAHDAALDEARREINRALTAAAELVLADITAALYRLEYGGYGACEDCASGIPLERLQVLPMVRLCMPCQFVRESSDANRPQHRRSSQRSATPARMGWLTMLPGIAESYWMETTPTTAYPPLTSDLDVDVAVIGGGIAGLCTAWELVRAGRTVALLESDRIAASVTGYTTAKLSSLHTLIYAQIRKSFGKDAARLYAESQQHAIEHVVDVARRLGAESWMPGRMARRSS